MDRNCFTYLIVNKVTNNVYYGARYARGCDPSDLWTTYFTSSKIVKLAIKKYGVDSFVVEVRKTFGSDYKRCLKWEHTVLRRLKVNTRGDFYNLEISGVPSLMYGEDNWGYGLKRPDASLRMKENNPMKNRESVLKMINKKTGVPSPTKGRKNNFARIKMLKNNPMKNKDTARKMVETRNKNNGGVDPTSKTRWMANVLSKIRKRVRKENLHLFTEDDGWIFLSNTKEIPDKQ